MPCSKTGRTIKYSPWYHLCSEETPPHSKTRNGGWPLPLARAGRQNSRATSSPPSRKLAPAASSLGIPCGSTALLHRLLQYSGILLYLSPEVKRNSPLLPAASPLLPSLYCPNCVFYTAFLPFPTAPLLRALHFCRIPFIQLQNYEGIVANCFFVYLQ